jgi:hypothetical protein
MRIPRKVKVLMGIGILMFLVTAWQYVSYWLARGYSRGSRTGIIRKVSVKGPPYCKYLEGEMALQGGNIGQPAEIFKFTVDDHGDANPIVQELKKAERDGARVTLDYRQDKSLWWRCNGGGIVPDGQYFIVKVER